VSPRARVLSATWLPVVLSLDLLWHPGLAAQPSSAPRLEVIRSLPRDPEIFTQGLALDQQQLYQSGGLRGQSAVVAGKPGATRAAARYAFAARYFAEGLTIVGDEVFVLTWQAGELFVLDKERLGLRRKLSYAGEGWGLAYDGTQLWLSDGSDRLRRYDPESMKLLGEIRVHDDYGAVRRINELEWAEGLLFANIWMSDTLVAIEPTTGTVVAEWDISELKPEQRKYGRDGVANGVAYDPASGRFWLTGKGWPVLYEVELRGFRDQ
jgi:glutamine cyclotransferase